MGIEDLAPEQLGKARACKSADELASFAKSEGVELTDEQLKKISGGDWDGEETVSYTQKCISCGKCAKVCPVSAIKMVATGEKNAKGKDITNPQVDDKVCISCSNCILDCPKGALKMNEVL